MGAAAAQGDPDGKGVEGSGVPDSLGRQGVGGVDFDHNNLWKGLGVTLGPFFASLSPQT